MKIRRTDLDRLTAMLNRLDAQEFKYQQRYGNVVKGTPRAVTVKDANALRRVLSVLKEPSYFKLVFMGNKQ
jgi:hypothetical protein